MTSYYNDNDPFCAQWLQNLTDKGHLPYGRVDCRSIADIDPDTIKDHTQTHFFAGIGGWPYALKLAGWPDDRPVWTGSCPCQPLSSAGKRQGHTDERHLWPAFFDLIAECRPPTIFGEQVASKDGREWLAGIHADLEGLGYAFGAADLCAASVGAPHIRQRLFWVADAEGERQQSRGAGRDHCHRVVLEGATSGCDRCDNSKTRGLGDTDSAGLAQQRGNPGVPRQETDPEPWQAPLRAGAWSSPSRLGHAEGEQVGRTGQPWQDSVWLPCLDRKARRIEPGTFPLAHGVPARVGRLRAYGNAIVPQVAAVFIRVFMECNR